LNRILDKEICVIGMGYVGIPTAALFANVHGFNVTGIQRPSLRSKWKIKHINDGKSPIDGKEPELAQLIFKAVKKKALFVTDDYGYCKKADIILIDVQIPLDKKLLPNFEHLKNAAINIGQHMKKGALIILESTVPPGTTELFLKPLLEKHSKLKPGFDFYLAYSFERVMPGKLIDDLRNKPRIVGGINNKSSSAALNLYKHIMNDENQIIIASDCITAELTKTIENGLRDNDIAFSNAMALLCEQYHTNVFEIQKHVNTRNDRNMLFAGAGVGGHCLPKDSILMKHGLSNVKMPKSTQEIIDQARKINNFMPVHMYQLIEKGLKLHEIEITTSTILILGLAYLENTDDVRNSPAAKFMCLRLSVLMGNNALQ